MAKNTYIVRWGLKVWGEEVRVRCANVPVYQGQRGRHEMGGYRGLGCMNLNTSIAKVA
jgi:hypothetical protein